MSDPKALPQVVPSAEIVLPGGNRLVHGRFDFNQTLMNVTHITPEAAMAMAETTKNQFAIPAQEETKRAVEETRRSEEETKRFRLRAFTYPPVLAAGILAMALQPAPAMWIAIAIVGVLGTIEGAQLLDKVLSRKK